MGAEGAWSGRRWGERRVGGREAAGQGGVGSGRRYNQTTVPQTTPACAELPATRAVVNPRFTAGAGLPGCSAPLAPCS